MKQDENTTSSSCITFTLTSTEVHYNPTKKTAVIHKYLMQLLKKGTMKRKRTDIQ